MHPINCKSSSIGLGIVSGTGNGLFTPGNNITREQIAVMFYRTMQAARPETKPAFPAGRDFSDRDAISSWALEAVLDMSFRGIISGVGDGRIDPQGIATREQAIALVKRLYENQ